MKVVYSFYGKLPAYSVLTVRQLRLFYTGDIFFIVSDMESPFVKELLSMNVKVVDYKDVEDKEFSDLIKKNYSKFCYCDQLIGREELFMRSMERFFLLHNLMIKESLTDVFFIELDNLIYNNPEVWLDSFRSKDMAYMVDSLDSSSSGICYVKNTDVVKKFMDLLSYKVENTTEFLSEMKFLFVFFKENQDNVQILPTHWESPNAFTPTWENYDKYDNSIFDSLPIGVYLTGADPVHTHGVIVTGTKSHWSINDYTPYKYFWKRDEANRFIPYVTDGKIIARINNLHIHSKNIAPYLSDVDKA